MTRRPELPSDIKETISSEKIQRALDDMYSFIKRQFDFSSHNVVLIGVQTRGYVLAQRIAQQLKNSGVSIPLGALDITLYRDDVRSTGIQPIVKETKLDFDLDDKTVILIDDVLFTGRTIRAALDELMDYGRPQSIHLVVLIDRGHREMPIEAEFAALKIETSRNQSVNLRVQEVDKVENIVITEAPL